MYKLMLKQHIV